MTVTLKLLDSFDKKKNRLNECIKLVSSANYTESDGLNKFYTPQAVILTHEFERTAYLYHNAKAVKFFQFVVSFHLKIFKSKAPLKKIWNKYFITQHQYLAVITSLSDR